VQSSFVRDSLIAKLPRYGKIFIKPNIVFWTRAVAFPKWGMITTSRVVEDTVALLKEHGIDNITIGEGTVVMDPKDNKTHACLNTTNACRECSCSVTKEKRSSWRCFLKLLISDQDERGISS